MSLWPSSVSIATHSSPHAGSLIANMSGHCIYAKQTIQMCCKAGYYSIIAVTLYTLYRKQLKEAETMYMY